MKTCPKCKIQVGGRQEYCPLCQSPLLGAPSEPMWPHVEPAARRVSMLYKVLAFLLLAGSIVCVTVDLLGGNGFSWSAIVVLCVGAFLIMLRIELHSYQNVPRLLFQLLLALSIVTLLCDAYTGWTRFSIDWVVPILCALTLVVNFVLSFIKQAFAENGLVYLLMNIVIGVVPYLLLLLLRDVQPIAWVVCLLVSIITFLGLVVFQGRTLWAELQKRLHL